MTSSANEATLHIMGVRHHGPGSARAVRNCLTEIQPDCVLVEGPPDANELIPWLAHPATVLPIALMVYRPDQPSRGTFYPFASFSPEYQALRYALETQTTCRFMDLPQANLLAVEERPSPPANDTFEAIAKLTGFTNYEQWWNLVVEQKSAHTDLFTAVMELMQTMRESSPAATGDQSAAGVLLAQQREATMRHIIRQAVSEGHREIAVICGAWHAPALAGCQAESDEPDALLLDGLAAVAVEAAWIPWTFGRMALGAGYGAGIDSPGWYDHLWQMGEEGRSAAETTIGWLAKAAGLLRDEGLDVSPAHVIDASRLAESLAALRDQSLPGLPELNEAIESVMCSGESEPMRLIRRRLTIGERMGLVPPDGPAVPLQRDLRAQQQQLNLYPEPEPRGLVLDLRREIDLGRSHLLHRLDLLGIPWGRPPEKPESRPAQGTYAEVWQLQWQPELSLRVVEAAMWGNTVEAAAIARVEDAITQSNDLPALMQLMDRVLKSDLPAGLPLILSRIEDTAVENLDVVHMLDTIPPLANLLRYGSIRQSEQVSEQLRRVFDHLVTRSCLVLPRACSRLDEAAAVEIADRLPAVQSAIRLESQSTAAARWYNTLAQLVDEPAISGIVAGRATRLLHEANAISAEEVGDRLKRALAVGSGRVDVIRYAADWLDGMFKDRGLLLVHDVRLWNVLDRWLNDLDNDQFRSALPLLRRTFASFPDSIRQQLQVRANRRNIPTTTITTNSKSVAFDPQRAAAALPVLARYLGIPEMELTAPFEV